MTTRRHRRRESPAGERAPKVCSFRLDEGRQARLREMAARLGTTPSLYARGVVTAHLEAGGGAAAGPEAAQALDQLGGFLRQVRDELLQHAEAQDRRLDAVAARLAALAEHVAALAARVDGADRRLADFLARVEPA